MNRRHLSLIVALAISCFVATSALACGGHSGHSGHHGHQGCGCDMSVQKTADGVRYVFKADGEKAITALRSHIRSAAQKAPAEEGVLVNLEDTADGIIMERTSFDAEIVERLQSGKGCWLERCCPESKGCCPESSKGCCPESKKSCCPESSKGCCPESKKSCCPESSKGDCPESKKGCSHGHDDHI